MKLQKSLIFLVLLIYISISGIALAELERGEMRGLFIKRAEKQVGERVYLAIIIKPLKGDEHVPILVPRNNEDFMHVARNLKEGQRIGLVFVVENEQKWLQRINVDRREPPRDREVAPRERGPRPPMREDMELRRALGENIERLMGNYRRLIAQFERMEQELRQLRSENERLRAENARLRRAAGVRESRQTDRRRDVEPRREGRDRTERVERRDREEQREDRGRERERRDEDNEREIN